MIKLSDKLSKHPVFSAMLVFVIIGLICLVLYTNNYYQPKLDVPPKLYLQTSTGKSFEMALIKYEWINGDKVSNYDIEFNPDTYEFKDENTAYVILDYEEPETYECTIYTNPKCRIAFMNENSYSNSYDGKNFIVYKNVFNDINDTKIEHQNIFNDILTYDVYFENGSMATYGVKFETYNLHKAEIFEKYADTKLSDKAKIEELVKKMRLGSFLKELRIEGNTIFLNYEYAQGEKYAYNMAEVLFVDIPELEKVVFDTIHDKVIANYYPDGVEAEATRTIEITREIVNEKTDQTIEQLQKILKNR